MASMIIYLGGAVHELRVLPSNTAVPVSTRTYPAYAEISARPHAGMRIDIVRWRLHRTGSRTEYSGIAPFVVGDGGQGPEHNPYAEPAEERHCAACLGTEDQCVMDHAVTGLRQRQYNHHRTGSGAGNGRFIRHGAGHEFRPRLSLGIGARGVTVDHCPGHDYGLPNRHHHPTAAAAQHATAASGITTAGITATASLFPPAGLAPASAAEFIEFDDHGIPGGAFGERGERTEHDARGESPEDRNRSACLGTEDQCRLDHAVTGLRQRQYDHHRTRPTAADD